MKFDLSPEIIDEVIFAMENQAEQCRFDTRVARTVAVKEIPPPVDEDRYVETPEWDSFKGFQLMERFVATLRNPVYREALREALARGKGVFRNFKNVLKEKREIERLWYQFKDREMKREVREWYEGLCEQWGCEKLDLDLEFAEDTDDLIVSDFVFEEGPGGTDAGVFADLDKSGFIEALRNFNDDWIDTEYEARAAGLPPIDGENSLLFTARSPEGELAGFIWGVETGTVNVNILQLYVLPEYRGFGLAKGMLHRFIEGAASSHPGRLTLELSGNLINYAGILEQEGYSLVSKRYSLDLKAWDLEGHSI